LTPDLTPDRLDPDTATRPWPELAQVRDTPTRRSRHGPKTRSPAVGYAKAVLPKDFEHIERL